MKRTKQLIISLIALLCCSTGVWAEGELKGLFSINENGDKVQFSQGNLQATYDGSDWSWAFAKNQWDYIGNAAANTSINGNGTVSTNGTVDLFSVSTSATTYGIHNSTSYETYSGDFIDWGNNMGDGWRTLASNEWNYIFMKRNSGSQVFGASNARYTHATINTDGTPVNGIILFPDGVTITYSEVTSWGTLNGESEWGTKCTSAQWTALEFKGCVFLPAAGWRYGAEVSYAGDEGFYLSSNTWESSGEWPVCFRSNYLSSSGSTSRHLGCSVRLVKDRQLNKDADGYYLLGTVDDWRFFAAHVAAGYSGAKARMTADIDLGDDQTTIGSGNTNAANANVMFRGVFDGNGHTLTVNYNTSEGFYAPIRHISGATIKNLHVTGSIISSGGRVGGIVCGVFGGSSTQSKIEKCRSSVVITSNCQLSNNDAESVGGIVGQVGFSSRLSIEDCIFDGEITGHVSNVIWSGLVGVLDGTVNTTRCLQAGSFNDLDNGTTSNSATIVCRWQNAATSIVTMDETYYIHPFKTVQGTQATTAQLADGTITTALNAGRTGDDAVWVQQDDRPMLKIFASEQEPEEYQQGGELNGLFTINANGDQIVFSQGNLQYFCSTTAPQWRFAEHQYDYVAFDISAYAANSGKRIDLFAHGTSGYDNGQTNFQPYVVGAAANTYYQGNLTGNADWGYNAISNGGNSENCGWRTLTRDEWIYLFSGRPNAASKYGHGSINGINGMILLPDSWTLPDGLTFTPGNQAWGKNTYTIDQWTMMEDAGAVFLPASGSCNSQGIPSESTQNQNGFYRASTAAYYLHFRQGTLQNCTASFYQYGDAVRLVKDYQLEQDCTLQQDAEGYYLLGSVQEWKDFAALVQTTPTAKARMTADIDLGTEITMIAEDLDHPYKGTFDGQGHTLTVNWTADGEDRVAPFRYAEGATIQRLHVDGSISKTGALGRCPAGILACSIGNTTTTISECWSSVSLYAFDTIGGLLSVACGNSTTNIVDCVFSGMISASNSSGCSGGFASHADKEYQYNTPGTPTVNITRGLNLGTFSGGNTLSYTFIRMGNPVFGTHTVNSCYYKNVYGNAQGAQATTAQLSDGTITTALNAGRTGDDAVWVQQDDQPMLKIFTQESEPVEPTVWENGVLPGEFTINANGDQIVFSQGNLQYQATTDTWRFAINQYDFVGAGNANISDTYDGWIDLIQWGAGNNPTTTALYKYQTFVEFGTHPISNGGNVADAWRTLTKDEWVYIFRDRTNAERLFAFGSVNSVNGLIILPDNWTTPDGLTFSPSTEHGLTWLTSDGYYKSNTADGFSHNVYTLEQWTTMENQGAVFLPAAGIRYIGTKNLQKLGTEGYYWSSDKTSSDHAYVAGFGANILNPQHNGMQDYGQSIRLVQAAPADPVEPYSLQQDEDGNYLLYTAQDMRDFAALVNDGNNTANAKVMNDIDLAGDEDNQWTPIGTNSNWYKGTFDGQGYTIRNLYWHSTVNGVVGLFAYADGATIKNLRVEGDMDNNSNSTTTGEQHTGGIVGYSKNSTLVINCSFAGTAKFLYDGGGIVGLGNSRIVNCYNEGTISFPSKTHYSGGGILGYTRDGAIIVNCYNAGSVINTLNYTGYIYPIGSGTLNSCYYRENCVKNGQSAGWSNGSGGGTAMSADDMKSESFISTLNANVASLRATYPDICEWKLNSDGYPVHANRKVIEMTPYAIWCEGNKTLYFDYIAQELAAGDIYDGQIITAVWSGEDVTMIPIEVIPAWVTPCKETVTRVVIKEGFKLLRPTNLNSWFCPFEKMQEIIGLGNLNTSQVTDMSHMFGACTNLQSIDVSGFNTSQVTNMYGMFAGCENLQSIDLSSFNTSQVTEMNSMFRSCKSLQSLDVSGFDTQNVTEMNRMFCKCYGLQSLDLSNFDTQKVTNMGYMFEGNGDLHRIYVGDLWKTDNVSYSVDMFRGCWSLVGGDGTKYNGNYIDKTKAYAGEGGYLTYSPAYLVGDANGNGEVEIGDVTSVLTLMATPEANGYNNKAADANGNGEIEIGDVTTILTIMAGGGK